MQLSNGTLIIMVYCCDEKRRNATEAPIDIKRLVLIMVFVDVKRQDRNHTEELRYTFIICELQFVLIDRVQICFIPLLNIQLKTNQLNSHFGCLLSGSLLFHLLAIY